MKVYLAGFGHPLEKTDFIDEHSLPRVAFLMTYFDFLHRPGNCVERFKWAKKVNKRER